MYNKHDWRPHTKTHNTPHMSTHQTSGVKRARPVPSFASALARARSKSAQPTARPAKRAKTQAQPKIDAQLATRSFAAMLASSRDVLRRTAAEAGDDQPDDCGCDETRAAPVFERPPPPVYKPGSTTVTVDGCELTLSAEQEAIITLACAGHSMYVGGDAGTGKTTMMRVLVEKLRRAHGRDAVAVTAPSGTAAVAAGGTTIHRWAGIGLGRGTPGELLKSVRKRSPADVKAGRQSAAVRRWRSARVLVIEEISMVRGDLWEKLEYIARKVRGDDRPFGGLVVIAVGDFAQLPPVIVFGDGYDGPAYVCDSRLWTQLFGDHQYILRWRFRQSGDPLFLDVCDDVRYGCLSQRSRAALNEAAARAARLSAAERSRLVYLGTHVAHVDAINQRALARLPGPLYSFEASDQGSESILRHCVVEKYIQLKVGARVMLRANLDVGNGLVNGAVGEVESVAGTQAGRGAVVVFDNGQRRFIGPHKWEVVDGGWTAARHQLPLSLAWAMTVHKAQGATLERAIVDLRSAFAPGQAYVGISRLRTLDGLYLDGWDEDRIVCAPEVRAFASRCAALPGPCEALAAYMGESPDSR